MKEEDDFGPVSKKKKGGKFGTIKLLLVVLVIGIVAGAVVEHQYIEPAISELGKKLVSCESTNALLDQEISACYKNNPASEPAEPV